MYDKCIMTWKTFLKLFKKNYELFEYKNGSWYFKLPDPLGTEWFQSLCEIILKYDTIMVRDEDIYFISPIFKKVTFVKQEELQWNPINKNIIIY